MTGSVDPVGLLRRLECTEGGVARPDGSRAFPCGVYIDVVLREPEGAAHAPDEIDGEDRVVADVERVLNDNRLRFELTVVREWPTMGEALVRVTRGETPGLTVTPLDLETSIKNALRRLPDPSRGVRLTVDPSTLGTSAIIPERDRLTALAAQYGSGTPAVDFSSLAAGQWFRVERLGWHEVPVSTDAREDPTDLTRGGDAPTLGARGEDWRGGVLRMSPSWLANPGIRVVHVEFSDPPDAVLRGFALLPRQRIPWSDAWRIERLRSDPGRVVVSGMPFEVLPSRRVVPVTVHADVPARTGPSIPAPILPADRVGVRLSYEGTVLEGLRSIVLLTDRRESALAVAEGPGGSPWFGSSELVRVWSTGRRSMEVRPGLLFHARQFMTDRTLYILHPTSPAPWLEVRSRKRGRRPVHASWWIGIDDPLVLSAGDDRRFRFELRSVPASGAQSCQVEGVELWVTTRSGGTGLPRTVTWNVPVPARFEVGRLQFDAVWEKR